MPEGDFEVYAPSGFEDLESLVVRPNATQPFDRTSYLAKAKRWKTSWPELRIAPPD